jgi:signal transduction histidine kinase/CheY-like chemotaxis protein
MDPQSPCWTRAQTVVLSVGSLLTLVAICATRWAGSGWITVFDNLHWSTAYTTAALVAALGWHGADAAVRRERGCFAATLGCYALGQFAWDLQVALGWNPFPGPSDALFVLLGPGMLVGLLLRTRQFSPGERGSFLLGITGVVAAILAYVLVLYLPRRGDRDLLTTCVLVAYPTLTLGATALGLALVLEQQLKITWSLVLFLGALGVNGVLWMEWNSRTLDGTLVDGVAFNYLFSIAAIAQGVGAALWRPVVSTSDIHRRACFVTARSLPLVLVLGAAIAIALVQRIPAAATGAVTVCVGIVVVAAAGHQRLLLNERDQMLRAEARARELEQLFANSQRLESLGTLAGGIAHDFNNILMAVYGHAQLLDRQLPRHGAAREALTNVLRGCERGRDVSRRVLDFARPGDAQRSAIDLRAAVAESLNLVRAALPAAHELSLEAVGGEHWVEADTAQLQRVIVNLAKNASDAIGARPGTIRILLSRFRIAASEHPSLAAGDYVELTITDSGCGMNEPTRRRAFEPFFTTKALELGTGLGLSVVHGIVLAHGGAIDIESSVGHGTRVRILLPALARRTTNESAVAQSENSEPAPGDGARILIVDDEEMLAPLLARLVQQLGFEPTFELSPLRALQRIEREPGRYSIVITDRSMPEMSGDELARAIQRSAPDLPVILSSGDVGSSVDRTVFAGVLQKPYGLARLAQTLEEVANRTPANAARLAEVGAR